MFKCSSRHCIQTLGKRRPRPWCILTPLFVVGKLVSREFRILRQQARTPRRHTSDHCNGPLGLPGAHEDSSRYCIDLLARCFQNKMKKIKEKYKDQDEEERQLRMQIIGVSTHQNQYCTLTTKYLEYTFLLQFLCEVSSGQALFFLQYVRKSRHGSVCQCLVSSSVVRRCAKGKQERSQEGKGQERLKTNTAGKAATKATEAYPATQVSEC